MIRRSLILIVLMLNCARADWPQLLGLNRNGESADSIVLVNWPKDGPTVLWKTNVGLGWSGPVVSSNRVVLFHRTQNRETVECFHAETGVRHWRNDYPATYRDDYGFEDGPRATPAIADGRVFTFGADGVLSCWSLDSGTNLWRIDVRKQFGSDKGFFGMAGSPLVEKNAVILNIGGRPNAGIVAFDVTTGRVRWKGTQQEASYSSPVAAALGNERCVLVLGRDALLAVDPDSGKELWEFPFRPRIQASVTAAVPLVIGNDIFISASYGAGAALLRYNRSKPQVVWSGDDILSNHYATSVHHAGYLYGFDGRQEQRCRLRCVDVQTGKVRWSEEEFGAGTLMVVGDHLLILSESGELILAQASPKQFRPVARAQLLGSDVRAYPALANGRFYARGQARLNLCGFASQVGCEVLLCGSCRNDAITRRLSCFSFHFAAPMTSCMRDAVPVSRKTLMVVEDDSEMRSMLSEILFNRGYNVFSSDDARSACDLARTLRPAAILCDIRMPAMSGFEAAECLRNDPVTRQIPVILMTGHSYLLNDRFMDTPRLFKPFTIEQLAKAIAQTTH